MNLAKSVLRYLKATSNHGLVYRTSKEDISIVGYSDSDWGSSTIDRKSMSGYCFKLSESASLISWCTKKQPTVALSTCEAKYMAICRATQEALVLRQLLRALSEQTCPISINVDNQGALALAKNPVFHKHTKHISLRFHFIRDHINKGALSLKYVSSADNIADAFTNPISKFNLSKFQLVQ